MTTMKVTSATKRVISWAFLPLLSWASAADAQELVTVGWNLESGGARIQSIGSRVSNFQGVDLWGFSEVQETWAESLEDFAAQGESATYDGILGTTGGADRLLIVYNTDKVDLVSYEELHSMNPQNRVRSPLVATFTIRGSGRQFKFMVNHLYRSNPQARIEQSTQLNAWGASQSLPVIAVGDYNYDWKVVGGETDHDQGYDRITTGDVFRWVRPSVLAQTQYSTSFAPSVLDFVFIADGVSALTGASEIVVVAGDFPDNDDTPDHRPVLATLQIGETSPEPSPTPTKQELLARIQTLERELLGLRQTVESMPD